MSQTFSVTAPADGQVIYHGQYADQAAINAAVAAAKAAQSGWRQTPLAERKAKVAAAINWLVAHRDDIARTITAAMGRFKWEEMGLTYPLEGVPDASKEDMTRAYKILNLPSKA